MNEPSVLDYLRSRLSGLNIPKDSRFSALISTPVSRHVVVPLVLALAAQCSLEPRPGRGWALGAALYALSGFFLVRAAGAEDAFTGCVPQVEPEGDTAPLSFKRLAICGLLALAAFLAFNENRFTLSNVALWGVTLGFCLHALRVPARRDWQWGTSWLSRIGSVRWQVDISPWMLLVLAVVVVIVFFRVYRLAEVPAEMVSDHAEKLLDVQAVLGGQTSIFFPRNTGREALQFYLTAGIVRCLGTGLSFVSLKIGTVLAGLVTLPFIYLIGREIGNRWTGLWALLFAGIAYWPNVISRIGLRLALAPLFCAPAFYYLLRGLRTHSRNDLLKCGIFIGLGLHGYSAFRVVPLLALAAFLIYVIHQRSSGDRRQAVIGLAVVTLLTLIVALPLIHYAFTYPEMFSYRAMTRLGSWERPLPGHPALIFLKNLGNALAMFAWNGGSVWVISVPGRPALDIVSGALFHLGLLVVGWRYLRKRQWHDLLLLLSIPLLLMPSVLSLAFPAENPILSRTAAAIVPVFVVIGIALDTILCAVARGCHSACWSAVVAVAMVSGALVHNYQLVFKQYGQLYALSSWNTSEMGRVIRAFADSVGAADSAWQVAYPHWADSRLVGFNAGYPGKDYALWPEHFRDTQQLAGPKLFLINVNDQASEAHLRGLYPESSLKVYQSRTPTKDFHILFVPGKGP